jgi:hypothetical protein
MLGITSPGQLHKRQDVKPEIKAWLMGVPIAHAGRAHDAWFETLEAAFGKRRFTKLELTTAEVYS